MPHKWVKLEFDVSNEPQTGWWQCNRCKQTVKDVNNPPSVFHGEAYKTCEDYQVQHIHQS